MAFEKAAKAVRRNGGKICIEWPKSCTYWHEKAVEALVQELGLKKAEVHGCAVGLDDGKGSP